MRCEECGDEKKRTLSDGQAIDMIRYYPDLGKWLHNDCYYRLFRQRSATGLVKVPYYLR